MTKKIENSGTFEFSKYRDVIESELKKRSGSGWGAISRLAEAIGCQRSHLSRVLKGEKDLTLEQAYAVTQFWTFGESEADYFLALLNFERAGTSALRARYAAQVSRLRKESEDISLRLKQPSLVEQDQASQYYSAWFWSAIHVLTSVPTFQTSGAISHKLCLRQELVDAVLNELARLGLVRPEKGKWLYAQGSLHLPKTSPFISLHHQNWRARAVLDAHQSTNDAIHYTVVQSISETDFERLKTLVLQTIDRFQATALPSTPQELVNFSCDFFRV